MNQAACVVGLLVLSVLCGSCESTPKVDASVAGDWQIRFGGEMTLSSHHGATLHVATRTMSPSGGTIDPVFAKAKKDEEPKLEKPGVTIDCAPESFLCPSEVIDEGAVLHLDEPAAEAVELTVRQHVACEGEACVGMFPLLESARLQLTLDAYGGAISNVPAATGDECVAELFVFIQFRDEKLPGEDPDNRVADTLYGSIGVSFPTACIDPSVPLPSEVAPDARSTVETWLSIPFAGERWSAP